MLTTEKMPHLLHLQFRPFVYCYCVLLMSTACDLADQAICTRRPISL